MNQAILGFPFFLARFPGHLDEHLVYYSANFSEKAFVKYVTADGTTVEAVESDYQVNSVLGVADVILAHPMASKAEKDYAAQIRAAV